MVTCDQHDYVEIACTYRFPIKLTLTSGETVKGNAHDTAVNEQREECIKIQTREQEKLIVLAQVARLEVLVDNPHFSSISF